MEKISSHSDILFHQRIHFHQRIQVFVTELQDQKPEGVFVLGWVFVWLFLFGGGGVLFLFKF